MAVQGNNECPASEEFNRGWSTYSRDPHGVTPYYKRVFEYDEMARNHQEPKAGFFG